MGVLRHSALQNLFKNILKSTCSENGGTTSASVL